GRLRGDRGPVPWETAPGRAQSRGLRPAGVQGEMAAFLVKKLEGKVAWISGATSGIGAATARLFAHEGAKVAVVGLHLPLSRRLAAELEVDGAEALPVGCDVCSERQVRDSIRRTIARFGRLDILINNAGIVLIKALHLHTEREWDRVMNVNVKSMFFALKHALPQLRAARRSWVVNVGS